MRRMVIFVSMFLWASLMGSLANGRTVDEEPRRVATARYAASVATSFAPSIFWIDSPIGNLSAVEFRLAPGEHFINVRVKDGSRLPVHGVVGADLDGTPETSEMITEFCGRTEGPIELPDVRTVQVVVRSGTCDGEPALATSGKVRVRFSAVP